MIYCYFLTVSLSSNLHTCICGVLRASQCNLQSIYNGSIIYIPIPPQIAQKSAKLHGSNPDFDESAYSDTCDPNRKNPSYF